MISLFVAMAAGAGVVLLLLARKNAPPNRAEWDALLNEDSKRLIEAFELQVTVDGAMASDALSRAVEAKDGLAFTEAIRLVDICSSVLNEAAKDRTTRLKGMALAVRMASAILPLQAVTVGCCRLWEVRSLMALGAVAHHVLISAAERFILRMFLLRYAYRLAIRAMKGGAEAIREDPSRMAAWARCEAAVKDVVVALDPAHVEAYKALLASVGERQRAA